MAAHATTATVSGSERRKARRPRSATTDGSPKGRAAFSGGRVVDQNYDAVIVQDLGNSPAPMGASKFADVLGRVGCDCIQIADTEQACIHAEMSGA